MSFFYYGDADIRHKLEFLEDEYLLKFNYQEFIEANLADSFGSSGFNASSLLSFGITLKNIKISS